ncbi:tetratricopeptide repeat protein [Telluria aromaticivorans]|uniref:Tetratricopeptide repeat protein n=1 Tax=Telluria aromaticivorans TaxID=2725995 RepID=A0A7Y2K357_9BURK|nr:tetratricopeptide repeat protein [Telluria aromaticivorans]NNG25805.1 tetratricopeptide repeat protein [Telluria aromaticivorans]
MRYLPVALAVHVALLACADVGAAVSTPAEKAARPAGAKSALRRGAPLPGWAQPLADIPRTERSDAVVLRLHETQALAGDQPAVLVNRAIQVNDRSALAAIGQASLSYYPDYQSLSLHRVAILREGKVLDRTATVEARVLQRETAIEQGVYGGASTIQLLLEDVRTGDTLWMTYSVSGANPVFGKKWSDEFTWDQLSPIELRRLTVLSPTHRKLAWRQLGDSRTEKILPRTSTVGPYEILTFEGKGIEALDDEASIPSDYLPARALQFSEFPDWASVALWASSLFPAPAANPAVKVQAEQFRKHARPLARAAAALHWVQDEIRYFSVSIGENSHRPQAPGTVLKRRYGDCKDKSYLLISLLGELGIEAKPVLLSTRAPRLPAKVGPSPGWFDHVIVEILVDGKRYYVDPTRSGQQVGLDALSAAFPGASALVVDSSSTALTVLPEPDRREPGYEVVETITIADDKGDAIMETRELFRAELAEIWRQRLGALSPLELKKAAVKDYEKRYPGILSLDAPVVVDSKQANQVELRARYRLPKAVKLADGALSIDYRVGMLDGVMGLPDKLQRSYPLDMPAAKFHGRYRLNIQWPDDVRASESPWSRNIENRFFHAHETYVFRGNQLQHMVDYRTRAQTVPASEVAELHAEAKQLDDLGHGRFTSLPQQKVDKLAANFSARDLDLLRMAAAADGLAQSMGNQNDGAVARDKACLLLQLARAGDGILEPANKKVLLQAGRIIKGDAKDRSARACRARMAFESGDFAASARLYHELGGDLAGKETDALRNMAWAQVLQGQPELALATMQQYEDAQAKAATRPGAELELIDRIALLQRAGRPLPPELVQRARHVPDGPWPRPLLAMQAGLISQEALLAQVDAMPEHARAYALTEALFYVGQLRLASKDTDGAAAALRRLEETGIRSSHLYLQGVAELRLLTNSKAGVAAAAQAVSADPAQAAHRYRQAAANGDTQASLALSELYRVGQGVPKDEAKSVALLRSSAELGNPVAMSLVGWRYFYGNGYPQDGAYAALWFQRAAMRGNIDATYGLGRALASGQGVPHDLKTAAVLYRAAASEGHAGAQLDLGYAYEMGNGVAKDVREAAAWYRKSAEQGNAIAQTNLGQFYADGTAVSKDEKAALSLFRKAAEQGFTKAMTKYGYLLEYPTASKPDSAQAHAWYLKAAEQDDPIAQYNLAQQFKQGRGVPADPAKAAEWYARAAKNGDLDAMSLLAEAFQKGEGVAKDLAEAVRWYTAAAEGGNALGALRLGIMSFNGSGLPRDYALAAKRFEQAVAAGEETGYFWLGLLHERGLGRPKDETRAHALYVRSESVWESNIRRAVLSAQGKGGPRDAGYFEQTLESWGRASEFEWLEKLARAFDAVLDGERAQQVYERMLRVAEKEERTELARVLLGELADNYARYEKYLKAEPHYLRLLALKEKEFGVRHEEVGDTLESLASVYAATARLALAESTGQRALEIRLATLGPASARTRANLRKLAAVAGARGNLQQARTYLTQAQASAEKQLGTAHADFPEELTWIAQKYYELGQYDDSEMLQRRALAIAEARTDPGTALESPLNGLAWTLGARGAHSEAERLFRRAVELREKRYGKEHHLYAAALAGLGLQLSKLDRHGEAEQALQQALALREVFLGKFDGEVALALNQSGTGWARQGKLAEAEAAFKKSLALRERVYTPVHAEIAESLHELGALYLGRQQFDKAEPLLRRALAIRQQLMPLHPSTRSSELLVDELTRKTQRL